MKILYICQHDPFAKVGGGSMASHAYLRAFADIADGQIDLVCAESIKTKHEIYDPNVKVKEIIYVPDRSIINKCMSVITGHLNRYIPFVRQYLKNNHNKYTTIVFDHSGIAGPLVKLAKSYGLKTITIHHNYEKEYYSDNNTIVKRLFFLRHVIKCEKNAFLNSDLNLFLTENDKKKFYDTYGIPYGKSFVIGVFEYYDHKVFDIRNCPKSDGSLQLVITGSLCTSQGVDGIVYFFNQLYPHISQNINVIIAGRNPGNIIEELCKSHKNVQLIPNPENMEDVIRKGDIYVCPTRVGGGLKLRVMDGLKLGLPVITHQCSARGYDMFHNSPYFKVFSNANEFAFKLQELIDLYLKNSISKKNIQNKYLSSFTYESGLLRLRSAVEEYIVYKV